MSSWGCKLIPPVPEDGDKKILGAPRYMNMLCTHMWLCSFPTSVFRDLSVRFKKQANCGNGRNSFQYLLLQKANFQQWHRNQPEKKASFPRRENECYPDDKSSKQTTRRGSTLVQCLRKVKSMWQKSSVLTSWPSSFPFRQHLSQTQKQQRSPRHQGLMPNHSSTNVFPATPSPAFTRLTLESPSPCRK